MFLQVTPVALPPHTEELLSFFRQFQIRKKIIPNLRVSPAHFSKIGFAIVCSVLSKFVFLRLCALGLLLLLLYFLRLCNQIVDLLAAKNLPQETEIFQFGA